MMYDKLWCYDPYKFYDPGLKAYDDLLRKHLLQKLLKSLTDVKEKKEKEEVNVWMTEAEITAKQIVLKKIAEEYGCAKEELEFCATPAKARAYAKYLKALKALTAAERAADEVWNNSTRPCRVEKDKAYTAYLAAK